MDLKQSIHRQSTHRMKRLRQSSDPMDDTTDTQVTTAGGEVDISKPESCLIGLAVGNQISDDTFGSCAYVSIDQAAFLNNLKEDWKRVMAEGSWYTFFVYDMVKLSKNGIATYE